MINLNNTHPYGGDTTRRERMIKKLNNKHKHKGKSKSAKREQREQLRLKHKAQSPGVPANTCPYIDATITMITDLQQAYNKLREKGEHDPMVDGVTQLATDTLEHVRRCNETLRDNSAYWYDKYKDLLKKQ
jgi:FtsZ-binding cell division protein ZapB